MDALKPLVADGLARVDGGVITVPEESRNLVRRVASAFDAYLEPAAGPARRCRVNTNRHAAATLLRKAWSARRRSPGRDKRI